MFCGVLIKCIVLPFRYFHCQEIKSSQCINLFFVFVLFSLDLRYITMKNIMFLLIYIQGTRWRRPNIFLTTWFWKGRRFQEASSSLGRRFFRDDCYHLSLAFWMWWVSRQIGTSRIFLLWLLKSVLSNQRGDFQLIDMK